MSAAAQLTSESAFSTQSIRRWDEDPASFFEATIRVLSELDYDQHRAPEVLPALADQIRRETVRFVPELLRIQMRRLVKQLPIILPSIEAVFRYSPEHALDSIESHRRRFEWFNEQIRLEDFPVSSQDLSTRAVQADVRARVLLLKSELMLIIAQFDLLQLGYLKSRKNQRPPSGTFRIER